MLSPRPLLTQGETIERQKREERKEKKKVKRERKKKALARKQKNKERGLRPINKRATNGNKQKRGIYMHISAGVFQKSFVC